MWSSLGLLTTQMIYLSIYLSIYQSIYLSINLSICISLSRLEHEIADGLPDKFRKWCAVVPHVMQGLPKPAGAEAFAPASAVEFLKVFRFSSATDEEGKHGSGYSPLLLAAASGNVPVVRELLERHKANLHVATRAVDTTIGFMDKGSTPLHAVMACCPPERCAMSKARRHYASPQRQRMPGARPLGATSLSD